MKVFAVPYGRLKTVGTVPLPKILFIAEEYAGTSICETNPAIMDDPESAN